MTALEITTILQTDIKDFTPTFRALPESDPAPLLTSHGAIADQGHDSYSLTVAFGDATGYLRNLVQ